MKVKNNILQICQQIIFNPLDGKNELEALGIDVQRGIGMILSVIAGLVAAARTVELGLRATVIERGTDEDYACNSRFAGGIYHVCYHDPKSEPLVLQKAIAEVTKEVSSPELVDAVANHAGRAVDWLHAQGVRFVRGPEKWQAPYR